MKKSSIILFAIFVCFLSGCQTVRNSVLGVGYVGKGLVDDTINTYKTLDKADKWWQKNYW